MHKRLIIWVCFFLMSGGFVAFGEDSTSGGSPSGAIQAPEAAEAGKAAKPAAGSEEARLVDRGASADWIIETYETLLPPEVARFMARRLGNFTLGELFLSFFLVLLTLFVRGVLTDLIFNNLERIASRTAIQYDDRVIAALKKPVSLFILAFGIYLAFMVLPLDNEWAALLSLLFRGFSVFLVFFAILRLVDIFSDVLQDEASKRGSSLGGFIPLIRKTVRVFVTIIGVIMVLDNLGYSVSGVLAGLGIGGAALAFASKDTIANLYGSIALALDRPFKVGDWIQVGDTVDGDVESIGLRSTRVRTWPKTQISIPNAVLANEMINNWSRMPKRRVKQVVGVTYETTAAQMEELVEAIRDILRHDEGVQQEFILVNFTDFGSSSLDILVYYFTTTTQWLEHMDVRQRINCKIMRAIAERKLSIAFPTRTLYLEGEVARGLRGEQGSPLPGDFGPDKPL